MRTLRPFFRFCETSKSLTKLQTFTEIQSKQMIAQPNPLRQTILQHIDQFGEMQIQRYWKIALTDPQFGYYGSKNVFSKQGDFTTSPEISPLFGEMFGVWIAYFLKKTGIFNDSTDQIQKRFRIVELGGGRGYYIRDILRSLNDLKINNNFDIVMIEVSEYNRKKQQQSLLEHFKSKDHFFKFEHEKSTNKYQQFTSENADKNINLTWVQSAQDLFFLDTEKQKKGQSVPFTIFVMNQFMDALPVSILKYTERGWKEKVLGRSITPNLALDLKISQRELPEKMIPITQNTEVSPLSLLTMDLLAKIISKYGGAILNTDYGDEGVFSNSIRAIKNHQFIPSPYFWQIPGQCDLSAYVNFKALAEFAQKNEGIVAYEAVPQGYFLEAMGIIPRMQMLKQNMSDQQKKRLESEYQRLVLAEQMGQIYKVQIITKKQYGQIYPHIQINEHSF